MNTAVYFAHHLGNKILHKFEKELILKSVEADHLICFPGKKLKYDECRMLFENSSDIKQSGVPFKYCILKLNGEFIKAEKYFATPDDEKMKIIIASACNDSEITTDELYNNYKKRNFKYLWPRQIIMAVNHKLIKTSQSKSAAVFFKDHATVVAAVKRVCNLLDTDKIWKEQYRETWKFIAENFDEAEKIFNLKWLK